MYLYIYDQDVQDKRYEREMAALENRLTDLGISGKIVRMALFRHAAEQIHDEARRGASTVVVVGGDRTIADVLPAVVESGLPLGFLPIGKPSTLAPLLGIPSGVEACDVLSARVIETIDTGIIGPKRFLSSISFSAPGASLICENKFRLSTTKEGEINICNLSSRENGGTNPRDGKLDVYIRVPTRSGLFQKTVGETNLTIVNGLIEADHQIEIFCDGTIIKGNKFSLSVDPNSLKVIAGKERCF